MLITEKVINIFVKYQNDTPILFFTVPSSQLKSTTLTNLEIQMLEIFGIVCISKPVIAKINSELGTVYLSIGVSFLHYTFWRSKSY